MTAKMRVVVVGKYYYPYMGGIETHLDLLCRGLRGRADVEAVVFNNGRTTTRETIGGVPVTRCGAIFTLASSPVSPAMAWELSRRTYDVLHLHTPNPLGAAAYLAAKKPKGHALIVTHHSDIVRQARLKSLVLPMMRRVLERADAIVATSSHYLATSKELEPFRSKCHVIPYGLDYSQFNPDPESLAAAAVLRASHPTPIILTVGRLIYYKGFDILIEAMRSLSATLVIVGEGPLRSALEAKAREFGVAHRVVFAGGVHNQDLLRYLLAADVFVLPSVARSEAFGIVQLEAMACRLPVVNTALDSGVPFVSRHNESGLTVPARDPSALSSAIGHLLADSQLRKRYGANGRRRVEEEFSIERMSAAVFSLYGKSRADTQSAGFEAR